MADVFIGIDGTTTDIFRNVFFEPWDLQFSFVRKLFQLSSAAQKIHIPGPDLFGGGTSLCVTQALDFAAKYVVGVTPRPRVILSGYSRGAYAALRVAQGLALRGVTVDFLGLFDVVKCTDTGTEEAIGVAEMKFAGQTPAPVLRGRAVVPDPRIMKLSDEANPGGGTNLFSYKKGAFNIPANVVSGFHMRRNASVNSRTTPMQTYPIVNLKGAIQEYHFNCTHSAMGGLPFRGDYPPDVSRPGRSTVTRVSEWTECGKIATLVAKQCAGHDIARFTHPALAPAPPKWWYTDDHIRGPYGSDYIPNYGLDGTGLDPDFEQRELEIRQLQKKTMEEMMRGPKY